MAKRARVIRPMTSMTRRQFLRRTGKAALVATILSQAELLSGCGDTNDTIWDELAQRLKGPLVRPGDAPYGPLHLPYNRRYEDVRPEGIASCLDPSDVRESILWAREHDVPVAIRSGGHNYAGYSTTDGLLIALGRMRRVVVEDDTGVATVQVGARNTDVYADLQPHEAAISAGRCPTVAIGGLLLGGGIGFSSRKLGLTCDSLLETEIVTADGQILTCNERENEDLFWACRGGSGGNFGVNVSYTFQATPVKDVSIYDLQWELEDGEKVLPALQDVALQAPDDFSCRMGGGRSGKDGGGRSPANVNALGQYFGPREELLELLEPVLRLAEPTKKVIADKTFWQAKDYFFHNTPTDRFQVKSAYVQKAMPEQGIEELLRHVASWPGSSNEDGGGFAMFALGGAVSRIPKENTAYVHRDSKFLLAMESTWSGSDSDRTERANIDWVEGFADRMRAYSTQYAYQNFIDRSQPDWAHAYYGDNLDRLVRIKRNRDPEDFFHFGQSVPQRNARA
jgi:FAD/FMN-containing dehydrogenase